MDCQECGRAMVDPLDLYPKLSNQVVDELKRCTDCMMRRPDESEAYDPRGLLFCMSCEVYGPYRTLRESNQFIKKHHGGSGVMTLRDRRPGWRKDRGLKPGYQQDYFDWMYRCHVAAQFFTDAEMAELLLWEKANLDGHSVATSDWPRWEEFVGRKPKHEDYD